MPLTVGTAGHIDHGKTRLVRALTGKDTDRLPDERRRGISIDLGYAPLELPDGTRMSLVDVPGHERFVRAMIAGATGIDLFLLVIDAREGAREQTHEHLEVLRLLGVDRGVAAVTKIDLVDDELREAALDEARALVPGAEVVPVSATTGEGLAELRAALARVAVPERSAARATRLYVDRAFTLPGIGTVATGTLWSGRIAAGDVLRAEPDGRSVRVRSVQVHDEPVELAAAGQRVAVSLPSIARHDLQRGTALVEPGHYPRSYRLDVLLDVRGEDVPPAVTVHLGTSAVAARLVRSGRFAQLRLAGPVVSTRGDRVVLRTETTIGGGLVLDPAPPRRLDPERLAILEHGEPVEIARALVSAPVSRATLQARGVLAPDELERALGGLCSAGGFYFSEVWLLEQRGRAHERLEERARANPLDPGVAFGELLPDEPWAPAVLDLLGVARRGGKAYLPGATADLGDRADAADALEAAAAAAEIVKVDDRSLAAYLDEQGRVRRVGDGYVVSMELYERGRALLPTLEPITLPAFRDALDVGRRTAQLLLERYDADGITLRRGDTRVLRRAHR